MLVRAGAGTLRKLSIPRDTLADIPGHGEERSTRPTRSGAPSSRMRTVEELLGINVDQVAIIDFDGFRRVHRHDRGHRRRPAHATSARASRAAPST